MSDLILQKYFTPLAKLLPLARQAYGSRDTDSPAHEASRQYTKLLVEYANEGGSLVRLAKELGVTYASLRRRVSMANTPTRSLRTHSKLEPAEFQAAVKRVVEARKISTSAYHDQLAKEYDNGVSLGKLANALGLTGSYPLYYGVNRSRQRANS